MSYKRSKELFQEMKDQEYLELEEQKLREAEDRIYEDKIIISTHKIKLMSEDGQSQQKNESDGKC